MLLHKRHREKNRKPFSFIKSNALSASSPHRKSICIRDLQLGLQDKKEFAEFIETSNEKQALAVMSRQLFAKQTLSHLEALVALSRCKSLAINVAR